MAELIYVMIKKPEALELPAYLKGGWSSRLKL